MMPVICAREKPRSCATLRASSTLRPLNHMPARAVRPVARAHLRLPTFALRASIFSIAAITGSAHSVRSISRAPCITPSRWAGLSFFRRASISASGSSHSASAAVAHAFALMATSIGSFGFGGGLVFVFGLRWSCCAQATTLRLPAVRCRLSAAAARPPAAADAACSAASGSASRASLRVAMPMRTMLPDRAGSGEELVEQLVAGARLGQELPAGAQGRGKRRDPVLVRRRERAADRLADERLDLRERLRRGGALADPGVEVDAAGVRDEVGHG